MLGVTWLVFQPLLMLGVYSFVFSYVFEARWGTQAGSRGEFGLFLFSGIIVYSIFAQCLTEAPSLVLPAWLKGLLVR